MAIPAPADVPDIARDFGRYAVTSGAHKTTVEWGQWPHAVSAYLASISYADAQLGRVLDALDASPYADNTLIVVWSDHGWQLGEKEHWGKFTAWEASTRVPLIIVPPKNAPPRGFKPGSRTNQPVTLLDVYPTVMDVLGVEKAVEAFQSLGSTAPKRVLTQVEIWKKRLAVGD